MPEPIYQRVVGAARALFGPGDVVEVRVPKAGKQRTISGYFANFEAMGRAVQSLENSRYPGVYWTINPVLPDLLARSSEKVVPFAQNTTADGDIVCRRWLPVDLDPKRPSGISSNATEHDAAIELAKKIRADLSAEGWPGPILADSGNGGHLLYRIALQNDPESTDLLKRVLEALANRFDTSAVSVDRTTFNASRIFKIYGTTARKGDSTEDRPHRVSQILHVPDEVAVVGLDLLRRLAASIPAKQWDRPQPTNVRNFPQQQFDIQQFLNRHGIRHRAAQNFEGGRKWVLDECPFDSAHKAPDSAVFEGPGGKYGFKCFHNSCHGRDWHEFRELFEPPAVRPVNGTPRPANAAAPKPPADEPPEPSITAADVEAAIDECISREDLIGAIRLAPEVAKLRPQFRAVCIAKLQLKFKRDFPKREFLQAMNDGGVTGQEPPIPPGGEGQEGTPPDGPDLTRQPLTDAGNGERIVLLFGSEIRYCIEMGRWLVWDGKRWAVDEANVMRQKGKMMARTLYLQAGRVLDSGLAKALEAHARKSESYSAITSALGQAATERGIPTPASDLDQQPFLLNCLNGVVDLREGKLLPHDREFLITKLCPFEYDPEAKCPRFQSFVEWAMGGNPEADLTEHTTRLVAFLQRAFGYSLTSDVTEKVIFILHGEKGNNGKTTLLTLFRNLLGRDYSTQIGIDTLMTASKNQDATMRADLADLRGTRFAMTSEVDKEHKVNSRLIKYLVAGTSLIKSCRKYENPIEFPASHKIFMDCNHRPRISDSDDAIWKRLRLVPFDVRISDDELDRQLPEKLQAELPGVLAWAVRGAIEWAKNGLGAPPEVSDAGQEWREHDDPLRDFLEDSCEVGETLFVRASDMTAAYEYWCRQNGEKFRMSREAFNERLLSKGFRQKRARRLDEDGKPLPNGKQARTWEGVELKIEIVSAIRQQKMPVSREWGEPG